MPGVVDHGGKKKLNKSAFRRAKKKAEKNQDASTVAVSESIADSEATDVENTPSVVDKAPSSQLILRSEDILGETDDDNDDPLFELYKDVFQKFEEPKDDDEKDINKPEVYYESDEIQDEDEEEETKKKLSKRARKEMNKLSIAELKAMVKKPELVEWTDVSSSDPRLLVSIKANKNVVPVPTHWSLKREYLSSKRGIEKPPFALPKFIAETGISEMRDAVLERQAEQTLKQKQRERVQGKLGKLDIDYQKLYEAFFRRQTKPQLTRYGEVYYEGKEYETNLKHLRPGELSDELKEALSMPPGAPPPWLINQQRYGPPPSYPNLRIPGLNAPPPPGASWGFAPGQYGKPPVDEFNRPLWGGDVLGTSMPEQALGPTHLGEPIDRVTWGELRAEGESEDEQEEDEEEEEESDEEEEHEHDPSGVDTSVSGLTSVMASEYGGTESIAGEFTLRKQRKGTETEEPTGPRSAYQVLPEQNIRASGFFGGERAYDLKAAKKDMIGESKKRKAGDVEVSVDVDALTRDGKLNKEELQHVYNAQKKAEAQGSWSAIDQDDLSEMIATESRKRIKRDDDRRGRR
jgi:splicing factor 3B subunit 2